MARVDLAAREFDMAKFKVTKMYKKILVPYWDSFSLLDPSTWFSRDYDSVGCRVRVMVAGELVRELHGKVSYHGCSVAAGGYFFESESPDGDVWVDCEDDVVCEVERLD